MGQHETEHRFLLVYEPEQTVTVARATVVIQEISIGPMQLHQHIRRCMECNIHPCRTLTQNPVVEPDGIFHYHRMYPVELDVAAACIIKFGKQKFVAGSNIIRQKPDVGVNGFYLSPLHTLNNLGHNLCRRRDMLFFHHPSVHNGIKKCEFFQNRMP